MGIKFNFPISIQIYTLYVWIGLPIITFLSACIASNAIRKGLIFKDKSESNATIIFILPFIWGGMTMITFPLWVSTFPPLSIFSIIFILIFSIIALNIKKEEFIKFKNALWIIIVSICALLMLIYLLVKNHPY